MPYDTGTMLTDWHHAVRLIPCRQTGTMSRDWYNAHRLVPCRHRGTIPTYWYPAHRLVPCQQTGTMPTDWYHADRLVPCRQTGTMPTDWYHASRQAYADRLQTWHGVQIIKLATSVAASQPEWLVFCYQGCCSHQSYGRVLMKAV